MTSSNNGSGVLAVAVAIAIALGTSASGCGGESSSSGGGGVQLCSGSPPAACGGDIVGKWELTDFCLKTATAPITNCPGGTTTIHSASLTGTAEYRVDGTETTTTTGTSSVTYALPLSCLKSSCADTATNLRTDPDVTSASCSQSGDKCTCAATVHAATTTEYSYTVNGSTITETNTATGETQTADFCVSGGTVTSSDSDGVYHAKRL